MTTQNESAYIDESAIYDAAIEPQYLIKESKFLLLSILTFGFYPIWWVYKTWGFFIQKERSDANPAIRVIFNIFFASSVKQDPEVRQAERVPREVLSNVQLYFDYCY